VTPDEREVLERAIRRVTEQAANADVIVDEAMDAGLDGSEPFVVNIKRLCAELLSFKGDLERELEKVQRTTSAVSAYGLATGHAKPAPHATPKLRR
jgi:hypothetical protein